jgi:ATP-dependent 26S proteasome regulatory subunit
MDIMIARRRVSMDKNDWLETNRRNLVEEIVSVRRLLEQHIDRTDNSGAEENVRNKALSPMLDSLCCAFGLSRFERLILLLCAGMEMDSKFGYLCAAVQGDASKNYPTFSLALSIFPDAHWSALTPMMPLRYWKLLQIESSGTIVSSPLRIDERVLNYIAGINNIDERLDIALEQINREPDLLPSHCELAVLLAETLSGIIGTDQLPLIQLCGEDPASARDIALRACQMVGLNLCSLSINAIPLAMDELEMFIRLWQREVILGQCALLVDCNEMTGEVISEKAIQRLIERINGPIIITGSEPLRTLYRSIVMLEIKRPKAEERLTVWREALGTATDTMDSQLKTIASNFNFNAMIIRAICKEAFGLHYKADELENYILKSCRAYSRPRLEALSQRIEPVASWDELVLPDQQLSTLHEIVAHVKWRSRVYDDWGFASKGSRGLGISALFAGASGTGKTMAAEVLANELGLDLYRIDLSQVVNKYIGETEKNLRRVFDAAEEGSAILLFDEADALFGKRSEVKDSHDRYANIEISYLLQRMEAYHGLAILTTNMKSSLDTAFMRRIKFIVEFPFPDASQRALIWKQVFPPRVPTDSLNFEKLARLNVVGGNIRNIALNAAFLAAEVQGPVCMEHLLHAARGEYAKIGKSLTDSEIRGWI